MVTVIGAEVAELPATSVLTAVNVCCPKEVFRVFQLNWYGEAVTVDRVVVPSRMNTTLATPDGAPVPVPLSVALPLTVTLVPRLKDDASGGAVMLTVGGAESIWISCDLGCSVLPATSVEAKLTIVVCETGNGAV